MARTDVLDILRMKKIDPLSFNFDNLIIPPINYYFTNEDISSLRQIATSIRLSSKITQKYKMIDDIMKSRGFKRFSAGTNRVVYSYLEDDRFLVKVAVDKVGMQDNPMEFQNQFLLKPYVTKMFYTSQCGTLGFVERVLPIKNKHEFKEIANDVFDIIINKILGLYVVEDIGTKFFMNWGIRAGIGPVLLDYPYIYKLDGNKLYCNKTDPITNISCNGDIDYNEGFNHLTCSKCGKKYLATDLKDNASDNKIIIKGGAKMKVILKEGDKVISTNIPTEETMNYQEPKREVFKTKGLVVSISNGDETIILNDDEKYHQEEKEEVNSIEIKEEPDIDEVEEETTNSLELNDTISVETEIKTSIIEDLETTDDYVEEHSELDNLKIPDVSDYVNEKSASRARDEKGRYISSGKSKSKGREKNRVKSNFIPNQEY